LICADAHERVLLMKWLPARRSAKGPTREAPCAADDSLFTLTSITDEAPWTRLARLPSKHPLSRAAAAVLQPLDCLFDRVYGSQLNPLYQSGALAIFLLSVVIVTGVYLLCFYKVSAPYESVARMHQQLYTGRWMRALHRYASDAAMVAVLFHVLRLMAQGRTWGPRAVAWVSGLILTGVLLLSGWTGQVMVWDVQAQLLAVEGGKLFDLLPIFSEPMSRAFVSNHTLPRSFFFLNLFVHVSLPLGAAVLLWIHVVRIARPVLFPPRALMQATLVVLGLFAVVWPPYMLGKADLLTLPTTFAMDWFFCFWLPVVRQFPRGGHLFFLLLSVGLLSVPWWLRPRHQEQPEPAHDNVDLCQGCDQCWQDCPFEAIRMVPRVERRERASERVAIVDPQLCVSCGLCAGSCAPMAIGPPTRTGRMQLQASQAWLAERPDTRGTVVVLVCGHNDLSHDAALAAHPDLTLRPINCSGALHTSVIEQLLRLGARGVCIISCPERNCVNREGPKWLFERVYNDREAELPRRVERARICLINASAGERQRVWQEVQAFLERLSAAASPPSGQVLPQAPTPSVLTQVRTFVPRLLVTVVLLALLSIGNRTPLGHVGSVGVLRLAWRLLGEKLLTCRDLSPAELAAKPLHMRQPRECTEQPLRYRLVLSLDGATRLDRVVAPAGARGDRPLYVHEDVSLPAGAYQIAVTFTPILPEAATQGTAASHQPRHLALRSQIMIALNQITLIDYDDKANALVVVHRR
jgi:ferredoxin